MKKTTILLMAAMAILPATAQLKVTGSGQVQVGRQQSGSSTIFGTGPIVSAVNDTTSTLKIIGPGMYQSGGSIIFGNRGDVSILESQYINSGSPTFNSYKRGSLILKGYAGFQVLCGDTTVISYGTSMHPGVVTPITMNAPAKAPLYLTQSDQRLKSNVEFLDNSGELLEGINPVSYSMNGTGGETMEKRGAKSGANLRYGCIAQEVREIFPNLVYEDENGLLSLDYQGFIPVLVDAVKELQGEVKRQNEVIATLTNSARKAPTATVDVLESGMVASLSQNRPNPFRTSTLIACTVPENAASAYICVYDLSGSQKLRRDIGERGETGISIEGNTLSPGMYVYSLIVDGAEIDSKRMILTD